MASSADPPSKPRIVQRLEAQRDRHRQRSVIVRALCIAVGFTLLLGGIAMLVLPGPAFLVIPVGLAVLSLEFAWAEEMLERALEKGAIAKQKAAETTKTQRILTATAGVLGGGAFIAWALFSDIPLLPV